MAHTSLDTYPGPSRILSGNRLFVGTNAGLAPGEQPRADDAEDGGYEEPGAALDGTRAAGEGGEEEDDRQGEEDVFGEHGILEMSASHRPLRNVGALAF